MNLYILNDVLYDYTSGMAVIAAESMEQCNQIFIEKFGRSGDNDYAKTRNEELQKEFDTADFKVIENVNVGGVGVISYVYGGG
jgi:glutamine cyclotransferase